MDPPEERPGEGSGMLVAEGLETWMEVGRSGLCFLVGESFLEKVNVLLLLLDFLVSVDTTLSAICAGSCTIEARSESSVDHREYLEVVLVGLVGAADPRSCLTKSALTRRVRVRIFWRIFSGMSLESCDYRLDAILKVCHG